VPTWWSYFIFPIVGRGFEVLRCCSATKVLDGGHNHRAPRTKQQQQQQQQQQQPPPSPPPQQIVRRCSELVVYLPLRPVEPSASVFEWVAEFEKMEAGKITGAEEASRRWGGAWAGLRRCRGRAGWFLLFAVLSFSFFVFVSQRCDPRRMRRLEDETIERKACAKIKGIAGSSRQIKGTATLKNWRCDRRRMRHLEDEKIERKVCAKIKGTAPRRALSRLPPEGAEG